VRGGQLLDVVAGRDAAGPCSWLAARSEPWRAGIAWATLDLSASYRSVFDTMLPDAVQVADPFHVVPLANQALDECRRRVQNETLGHRGRKTDPLYRCRRRLVMVRERLSVDGREKLLGLLAAGDPRRDVWFAWNAKEVVRQIYDHTDHQLAADWVDVIVRDFADGEMPPEVRRLGRTIAKWRSQIVAWDRSHVSNGPTEAVNNLVKRSSAWRSGSVASTTTGSAHSSTPADRTGPSSTPSPHHETGSASSDDVGPSPRRGDR
jgi:transposase